jgi:hypothetical protein
MACLGAWMAWIPGKLFAAPVTMGGAFVLARILSRKFKVDERKRTGSQPPDTATRDRQ